ncbi:hypothetical protein UY3_07827 [Chelonia mydas]|uniref:Uncharacterized protein n=1 Tax=Chelonia mydas TaxID=8469 RepID=M7BCW2_CHEMY|nr:hypothetical protein UY3_07827 [Chelonia mydas]
MVVSSHQTEKLTHFARQRWRKQFLVICSLAVYAFCEPDPKPTEVSGKSVYSDDRLTGFRWEGYDRYRGSCGRDPCSGRHNEDDWMWKLCRSTADASPSTLPTLLPPVEYRSRQESAWWSIYRVFIRCDKSTLAGSVVSGASRSSSHHSYSVPLSGGDESLRHATLTSVTGTWPSAEPQEEALEEPAEHPEEEVNHIQSASSSSSPDEAVSSDTTSSPPSDYKTIRNY